MKKVGVVGSVGLPAAYSGFETLVENLVENLHPRFQFTIYCSRFFYKKRPKTYKNARLVYIPLKANGVQSIPYDLLSLMHALFIARCKTVLVLGVGIAFAIPLFQFLKPKTKIIVHMDGLEWKRSKWGGFAKSFLKYNERVICNRGKHVLVDNQGILDYVKETYGLNPYCLTYGASRKGHIDETIRQQLPAGKYALAIARIVPENNIDLILEAFSKLEMELVFIGDWKDSPLGVSLTERYSTFSNIHIINKNFDVNALFTYKEFAHVYVHGHSVGGTNPSLVEAMHFALPIVAYDAIYNQYTTNHQAIYFSSADQLIERIKSLGANDLNAIGNAMQTYAQKHFIWEKVANDYAEIF